MGMKSRRTIMKVVVAFHLFLFFSFSAPLTSKNMPFKTLEYAKCTM